jgi:hypothetical protein
VYIVPSKKLIFLSQPKTGSTSIAHAVLNQLGGFPCGGHHSTPESNDFDTTDWKTVTVVRNHFDVIVSWWHYNKCHLTQTLDKFIDHFLETSGHVKREGREYFLYHTYPQLADVVLRYETLQKDFNEVCGEEVPLPRFNTSNQQPFPVYYKPRVIEKVRRLFKSELAKYGYKWPS